MDHWSIVKDLAELKYGSNEEWVSFVHKKRYRVKEIHPTKVLIEKCSGGIPVWLTKGVVNNAAERLRKKQFEIRTNLISGSVARESALINLHPYIFFDHINDVISWSEVDLPSDEEIARYIAETPNDVFQKVSQLVTIRKYQSIFRKNLLIIYNGKCCISGCGVEVTLEAAHIIDFCQEGINENANGLLLRADLHCIFDRGLLLIHPNSNLVYLHSSIKHTEYQVFEGRHVRLNGPESSRRFLLEKWNISNWTKPI